MKRLLFVILALALLLFFARETTLSEANGTFTFGIDVQSYIPTRLSGGPFSVQRIEIGRAVLYNKGVFISLRSLLYVRYSD